MKTVITTIFDDLSDQKQIGCVDKFKTDEASGNMKNKLMSELEKVKKMRKDKRKRRTWAKSKLQKHYCELFQLRSAGAKYVELQIWLKDFKRVKVERSTIMRFLKKMCAIG